jgi:predicted transcriptional regulator of viral defense system
MHGAGRIAPHNGVQIDRLVGEVAARQHGLITLAELFALGISSRMIESRMRRGFLIRIYPGVYAVGHRPATQDARWLAAVLACGDGAVLSHRSAAALWMVRQTSSPKVDVTAPTRRGYSLSDISLHRANTIQREDLDEVRSIPVTALPRTVVDLATCVSDSALAYAIHNAERQRKLTPDDLREILDRLPGKKGTAAVRAIVERAGHDLDARTRSRWELRFLEICRTHGIPEPRVNEWIPLDIPAGGLEVDFHWPAERLVVEVDENRGHRTMRARHNDPQRDRALRADGWSVTRIPEADFADPASIAATVLRALATSRQPHRSS